MPRLSLLASFAFALSLHAQSPAPKLPEPFATPSVTKHPKVIGWPEGKMPSAPEGFSVSRFADINNPRWLYVLPNGDILVSRSRTMPKVADKKKAIEKKDADELLKTLTAASPNAIALLRDADGDGKPEVVKTFLDGILRQPFGMCLVKETLFVAATDGVFAYAYQTGQTRLEGKGTKILDLPAGGYNNHWTRNVVANKDGTKLYVSVGSASNVAEHGTGEELLRACVLECNLDGTGLRVFAGGLRNPVGLAWEPTGGALWTAVNERDGLGDDLVPDYITSVKDGGFYGWPFAYFGANEDPRRKGERPDLVKQSLVPDLAVGPHTASLGLAFGTSKSFPQKYSGGAFIGQRGSWNRSKFAGYRVAFAPFKDGKPSGPHEDFLTGFIASDSEVHGRPVGVAFAADGSLLVADEPSNIIWRVAPAKSK